MKYLLLILLITACHSPTKPVVKPTVSKHSLKELKPFVNGQTLYFVIAITDSGFFFPNGFGGLSRVGDTVRAVPKDGMMIWEPADLPYYFRGKGYEILLSKKPTSKYITYEWGTIKSDTNNSSK